MAIKSGFFNSNNGDRRYLASSFAEYFATFISNGVFPNPSNGCQIIASDGMNIVIKPGKAWINGYFLFNDADYQLTLDVADGVLNRIDRVVLQLNFLNREIGVVIKKGTPASTPVAPVLQRDVDVYEIALADIVVNKGVISISQSNISDLRLNSEYCGVVHGTVNQVDTTSIFNQYLAWFNETKTNANSELSSFQTQKQEEFQTWFDSVKGILEGDVAANLTQQISILNEKISTFETTSATKEEVQKLSKTVDEQAKKVDTVIKETEIIKTLRVFKSNKDDEGIFTKVTYRRKADDTLYCVSTLSGGTSPLYTTRTEQYYDVTGTSVVATHTYTLSYDEDENLISEV